MRSDQISSAPTGVETGLAFSAGLEAGLVGAVLALISRLLQYFLLTEPTSFAGLIFCGLELALAFGVGALAVYWLKSKGSLERAHQKQAGLLAGIITGLAIAIFSVMLGFIQGKSLISTQTLPEDIPIETFNQFFGVSLICCVGLPTLMIAIGSSFLGSLIMSSFVGRTASGRMTRDAAGRVIREAQAAPQAPPKPARLDAYLTKEGLPIELHPVVAAYQRGEVVEARAKFVSFVRQNPRYPQAWLWLAVMLDNPAHQIESVKRALAIDPENQVAHRMLAMLQRSAE